jgi:hypothetical protein
MKKVVITVTVLAILALMGWGIFQFIQQYSGPNSSSAYSACKSFVTDQLKSPSTAEFPSMREKGVAIEQDRGVENQFNISGYVDSKNGFGAMIRTKYYCEVYYGKGDWTLFDLSFE